MFIEFDRGTEYRRQVLLDFVGSRQGQSGVLWGSRCPSAIICTSGGRHGRKAGYADEQLSDGSWLYFGQGTSGDQSLKNPANRRLATQDISVLLFTCREANSQDRKKYGDYGKLYQFVGAFNVASYDYFVAQSGERRENILLRFHLAPSENSTNRAYEDIADTPALTLRDWIIKSNRLPKKSEPTLTTYWQRCAAINRYAQLRSKGVCEGCEQAAAFRRHDGTPYLEVHHLLRLSDDGPDSPENVAALCANCHRRVHFGHDGQEYNSKIMDKIRDKELMQ